LISNRIAAIAQIAATVIQAARASELCDLSGAPFRTHILSRMSASTHELALRYLLELTSDIRLALLLDRDGRLVAAAPQEPPGQLATLAAELSRDAGELLGEDEPVELDAACDGGAVFLIRYPGGAMICLTERSVLPPLIFYDMHAVLTDLERAAGAEARRVGAAGR
jgi:hypothetical protein